MKKTALLTIGMTFLGCCFSTAQMNGKGRQGKITARGLAVEGLQNSNPQFAVRVSVDRKDRTYREGEHVVATVVSSREGYLYLLYCQSDGQVKMTFPNQYQKSNRIRAHEKVVVPADGSKFQFTIVSPFGTEVLQAIVTDQPVKATSLPDLTKSSATDVDVSTLQNAFKAMRVDGVGLSESDDEDHTNHWAEHSVEIRTLPAGADREVRKPRRFAVLIGISKYESPKIRNLLVCDRDAQVMKTIFMEQCGVAESDCVILLNEEATMANVRKVFCEALPKLTREGDVIFIYWSGHGGRCADAGGDEKDGFDEYLPVHDSKRFEMETMLMDDTFGCWVQKLDGRKIVVILDACHSGGQANKAKALAGVLKPAAKMAWMPFDFVGNELSRVKDIGQKDVAIVASSTSAEVSHERLEGDLSALTYFLIEELRNAALPVTLNSLVEKVTPKVAAYINSRFPGAKQSVYLQNDLVTPFQMNR